MRPPGRRAAAPHQLLPRRRLRLQDRPGRALRDPALERRRHRAQGADGRHRDRRRCRGLPPQRRAGADRHHRLLHADRRRPVRLRPDRRDQRDQRRLRDGRQADHGAGAGGDADRQAHGRADRRRDPRRRVDLPRGRHPDRRRPHHRFGRADLRPGGDGPGPSRQGAAQCRCEGRRRARARQADRRRRAVGGAEEERARSGRLRPPDRHHHPAQHARHRPRRDARRACDHRRHRLRPRRPCARDGARREARRDDRLVARCRCSTASRRWRATASSPARRAATGPATAPRSRSTRPCRRSRATCSPIRRPRAACWSAATRASVDEVLAAFRAEGFDAAAVVGEVRAGATGLRVRA